MDQVRWRKPINYLMAVFIVFGILSYFPDLSNAVKGFLLIPALVSLGYLFECGASYNTLQSPSQRVIKLRSLLFPLGAMIFILISGVWENKPFLEAIAEPIFWMALPLILILWLVGSALYRYLRIQPHEKERLLEI